VRLNLLLSFYFTSFDLTEIINKKQQAPTE